MWLQNSLATLFPLRQFYNFPVPPTTTTKTTIEQKKIVWKWFDLSSEWFSFVLNIALPIQMTVWLHRTDFGTKINWSLVVGIKIFPFFPLSMRGKCFIQFHFIWKDILWICIRAMVYGAYMNWKAIHWPKNMYRHYIWIIWKEGRWEEGSYHSDAIRCNANMD